MPGMNTSAGERGMSKSDNSHKFLNLVREKTKTKYVCKSITLMKSVVIIVRKIKRSKVKKSSLSG